MTDYIIEQKSLSLYYLRYCKPGIDVHPITDETLSDAAVIDTLVCIFTVDIYTFLAYSKMFQVCSPQHFLYDRWTLYSQKTSIP